MAYVPRHGGIFKTTKTVKAKVFTDQLSIPSQTPPGGTNAVAYTYTFQGKGGVVGFRWQIVAGAQPTGTSLALLTGVLSGTPSAAGTYNFTVQLSDSRGNRVTRAFTIVIA